MRDCIGPWLAGQFDTDRLVSQAARVSIEAVFDSVKKRDALYKLFTKDLTKFINNVLLVESASSLSDYRFVSKEEAESKYHRVVRASLCLAHKMIEQMSLDTVKDRDNTLAVLLSEKEFWKLTYSSDIGVSQVALALISVIASEQPHWLNESEPEIFKYLISSCLKSCSTAVAVDLLQTLIKLTKLFPSVWHAQRLSSSKNKNKHNTSPVQRLCGFISKGSPLITSSRNFWLSLLALLSQLPESESPYHGHNIIEVTKAFDSGVQKQVGDPTDAWGSYFNVIKRVSSLSDLMLDETILQVDMEVIVATAINSSFSVLKFDEEKYEKLYFTIGTSYIHLSEKFGHILQQQLSLIREELCNSKDSVKFQRLVFLLNVDGEGSSLPYSISEFLNDSIKRFSSQIQGNELSVLEELVSTISFTDTSNIDPDTWQELEDLMKKLPSLIETSSLLPVSEIFKALAKKVESSRLETLQLALKDCLLEAIKTSNDKMFFSFVNDYALYRSLNISVVMDDSSDYVLSFKNTLSPWNYTSNAILAHSVFVSDEVSSVLLNATYHKILESENLELWLTNLLNVVTKDPKFCLSVITSNSEQKDVLSLLWHLEDSNKVAAQLLSKLEMYNENPVTFTSTLVESVVDSTQDLTFDEISETVVKLVNQLDQLENKQEHFNIILDACATKWKHIISLVDGCIIPEVLGISNRLEGGINFFTLTFGEDEDNKWDLIGNLVSETATICFFITRIFYSTVYYWDLLPIEQLIFYLSSLLKMKVFWDATLQFLPTSETLSPYLQISSDELMAKVISKYFKITLDDVLKNSGTGSLLFNSLWEPLDRTDMSTFLSTCACSSILEKIFCQTGNEKAIISKRNEFVGKNTIKMTAFYKAAQSFALSGNTFDSIRNQLASEFINRSEEEVEVLGLNYLVPLNILLNRPLDDYKLASYLPFPLNRLGMVITSLKTWTTSSNSYTRGQSGLRAEITKFLTIIVRLYDDLPQSILDQCYNLVSENLGISFSTVVQFYNLRLINSLRKVDIELFEENQSGIYNELIEFVDSGTIVRSDMAIDIQVSSELLRVMSYCEASSLEDPERLYNCFYHNPVSSQIAFNIMQGYVTKTQEDRIIEFELKKSKLSDNKNDSVANLIPDNLLLSVSLSPREKNSRYGYFLAWKLIFQFFENITFGMRRELTQKLSQSGCLTELLQYLGSLITNKSLNEAARKQNFLTYISPQVRNPTDDEIDCLALHVYYLCLRYIGSLVKTWYINFKGRGGSAAIKNLTEKYVSPLLISDELKRLEETLDKADGLVTDDFDIRIIPMAKEIHALYTIDDQTMEMSIKIPSLYPLEDLRIVGEKRIGVKERQWRAWILASQAISSTQNGSITDILELFKRNVSLHFEGLEECAICYSILHQDHTLPSKTCMTCKKKFHTDCLYKWFKSAGNNTCPLCRSSFSFRVVN